MFHKNEKYNDVYFCYIWQKIVVKIINSFLIFPEEDRESIFLSVNLVSCVTFHWQRMLLYRSICNQSFNNSIWQISLDLLVTFKTFSTFSSFLRYGKFAIENKFLTLHFCAVGNWKLSKRKTCLIFFSIISDFRDRILNLKFGYDSVMK